MRCQEAIGYLFRRQGLLRKALTHSSVKDEKHPSNERLEFLGDAILGMAISEYLFSMLPSNDEGDLTKVKSVVVSGESLSRLGLEIGLDRFLLVGKGIRQKKEIPRSLIANTVEAMIAAVYLDRGMEAARHFVLDHLHGYVEEVLNDDHQEKNYKSLLQQYAQRQYSSTPTYRVLRERGPDHSKSFRVAAVVGDREFAPGSGQSKKEAEQDAARTALAALADDRDRGGRRGRGKKKPAPREGARKAVTKNAAPSREPEPASRSRRGRKPAEAENGQAGKKPERSGAPSRRRGGRKKPEPVEASPPPAEAEPAPKRKAASKRKASPRRKAPARAKAPSREETSAVKEAPPKKQAAKKGRTPSKRRAPKKSEAAAKKADAPPRSEDAPKRKAPARRRSPARKAKADAKPASSREREPAREARRRPRPRPGNEPR